MRNLAGVCKRIINVPQAEIDEARVIAQHQIEYMNPLKMLTTFNQNNLGAYNIRVLDKLEELKIILMEGKEHVK